MNIEILHNLLLNRIDELVPIGKNTEMDGVLYHIMGLTRKENTMRMVILHYDEAYINQVRELEIAQDEAMERGEDIHHEPKTNRQMLSTERNHKPNNPFMAVAKMKIFDEEFQVSGAESRWISTNEMESVLLMTEFLRKGWTGKGMRQQNLEDLFITSIEFQGECKKLPSCDANSEITFRLNPCQRTCLVEQPILLTIGDEYPEKFWFTDKESGENHWLQINRVYLRDVWADVLKSIEKQQGENNMSPDHIEAIKRIEEGLSEVCPRGMFLPVVEYETDQEISPQFYSKKYLDGVPVHRNGSLGFTIRTDKEKGRLGLKLRAFIIQDPVTVDTKIIEAELFQYNYEQRLNDIILK